MASIQLAATMSPGPAFVVAVRNALSYGRQIGVYTALGLALGVGAHIGFVLAGIAVLIAQSLFLFEVIRYAGAAYLVYIGVKTIIASYHQSQRAVIDDTMSTELKEVSVFKAMMVGFLTNLLNPKAVIFFTAIFSQFIGPETAFATQVLYGVTSIVIEFLWFTGVTIVLTNAVIQSRFMAFMHWVDRVCGGLMIGLGIKLALSK